MIHLLHRCSNYHTHTHIKACLTDKYNSFKNEKNIYEIFES